MDRVIGMVKTFDKIDASKVIDGCYPKLHRLCHGHLEFVLKQ